MASDICVEVLDCRFEVLYEPPPAGKARLGVAGLNDFKGIRREPGVLTDKLLGVLAQMAQLPEGRLRPARPMRHDVHALRVRRLQLSEEPVQPRFRAFAVLGGTQQHGDARAPTSEVRVYTNVGGCVENGQLSDQPLPFSDFINDGVNRIVAVLA